MRDASPLRYPGGKWRLAPFLERLLLINGLICCEYVEPYAGGASLALSLLVRERVSEIHLNDLDPAIYAFWYSVLGHTTDFIHRLKRIPVTPDEREKQKAIYAEGAKADKVALGFATFFLNRTNHSGIMNGGMIGGTKQLGEWRIDARFNRADLQRRIERVAKLRSRIHLSSEDAVQFLKRRPFSKGSFVYLDPPYFGAGRRLYLNAYDRSDHETVSRQALRLKGPWMVSYDDVPQIRTLYRSVRSRRIELLHTAREAKAGREILFFAPDLLIPSRS